MKFVLIQLARHNALATITPHTGTGGVEARLDLLNDAVPVTSTRMKAGSLSQAMGIVSQVCIQVEAETC